MGVAATLPEPSEWTLRTTAAKFQNALNANFDLYVISLICIDFEAFTTIDDSAKGGLTQF